MITHSISVLSLFGNRPNNTFFVLALLYFMDFSRYLNAISKPDDDQCRDRTREKRTKDEKITKNVIFFVKTDF